jgi:hypothetical protein
MACVTRILVLRGTTAQRLAFTPLSGELVWDIEEPGMYVGDGSTLGGIPLSNLTNEQIQDIIGALIGDSSTIDVTYDDAGNVLTMEVITSALNHDDLANSGTNTHAQIDAHIANTINPHTVTITQAINADGGTDITVSELEILTDGSDATALHNHDSRYYTESEIDAQQLAQDMNISQNASDIAQNASDIAQEIIDRTNADANLQSQITSNDNDIAQNVSDIAQNASDIAQEITDRTNADAALQSQITSNDNDIAQNASDISQNASDIAQNASDIAQNASDLSDHEADTNNPHNTTFTQAVAADPGTDITPAEAETLTDGSDAGALHNHDVQYKKAYWQGAHTVVLSQILSAGKVFTMTESKNSDSGIFTLASNELEINKDGDFKFDINITTDNEPGSREHTKITLLRDSGGGFVAIPPSEGQSIAFSYNRNSASGEGTASLSTILTVSSGDKFRLLIECPSEVAGPDGVRTVVPGCGFIVEEK